MKKYLIAILFPFLMQAQSELLLLMDDDAGIGDYPVTADLVSSYDEREMTVSGWVDQTGANDFAQATATNQPIKTANAINGYPGLLFDGSDNFMNTVDFGNVAQPYTFYFVVENVSWTDGDKLISAGSAFAIIAEGGGGTNLYMFAGSYEPIRTFGVGEYKIASCVYNGATSIFQVNDDVATGNTGTGAIDGGLFLCSNNVGATQYGNFEVVAFYYHSTAHDLATRTTIINWLNSKYEVY